MKKVGVAILCGFLAILFFFSVVFHEKNLTFNVERYLSVAEVSLRMLETNEQTRERIEKLWVERSEYTAVEVLDAVIDFFNDVRLTAAYSLEYMGVLFIARDMLNPINCVEEDTYVPYWYREEVKNGV